MKKDSGILKKLLPFMGKYRAIFPLTFLFSGLSAVFQTLPYYYVWRIVRTVLEMGKAIRLEAVLPDAIYAVLFACLGLLSYFIGLFFSHIAAFEIEIQIKKQAMKKILSKPLGFFATESSGKIRKAIYDGASKTHAFIAHQLPDLAGIVVTPILMLVLFFWLDWRLGLASFIPIAGGIILMATLNNEEGKQRMKKYFEMHENLGSEAVEYVRGIPVVKTFGQTVRSFKRFYGSIVEMRDIIMEYTLMWRHKMAWYYCLVPSAAFVLIPLAILFIGWGESISTTVSNLLLFLFTSPLFGLTMMRSAYYSQVKTDTTLVFNNIQRLIEAEELAFPSDSEPIGSPDLTFTGVTFAYDENKENQVLKGISFSVKEGQSLAIVGASGSGKTTIARLAARFWDADSGEITIGGRDIRSYSQKALMSGISFVFQNSDLFKMTIRENLLLAKPNATEEELAAALERSQAKEIIDRLPAGLETVIGSKGVYLSGGEKQRIALARAFLKDAPLLLLDEATAFADPENEHLLQKALKNLRTNKTTLFIAHRLSTVRDMDQILVLDKGKIVEMGSHDELVKAGGHYQSMYEEYEQSIQWKIGGAQ